MKKITLFVTLLGSLISFGQELILNGGFENWDTPSSPTSFSKAENTELESTEKHSGSYAAKHTGGTKDISQTIAITPENYYKISLWYKTAQAGDGKDSRIWSYWKNGNTNVTDHGADLRGPNNLYFTNNTDSWSQYEVTLQAPVTANSFYLEVRTYSGAITYWDDLSVIDLGPTLSIKNNQIESLKITSSDGVIHISKGEIVSIYNVVGQQVENQNLPTGIYVVMVTENNITIVEKVYVK